MYHMAFELLKEKYFIFICKLLMYLSSLQQNHLKLFTLHPLLSSPQRDWGKGYTGDNTKY